VQLRADEFEALRLMDYESLYQEECAVRMKISRTTLSRTVASARSKVADALLHGKRLLVAPKSESVTFSRESLLAGTSSRDAVGNAPGENRKGVLP